MKSKIKEIHSHLFFLEKVIRKHLEWLKVISALWEKLVRETIVKNQNEHGSAIQKQSLKYVRKLQTSQSPGELSIVF